MELLRCLGQELQSPLIELAVFPQRCRGHLGVASNIAPQVSLLLAAAGLHDSSTHCLARLAMSCLLQLAEWHGWHLDMEVDPIEEGAGYPAPISLHLHWGAGTGLSFSLSEHATGAGIHRGDELYVRRKGYLLICARDHDGALFEWLSQSLEDPATKLGELIEKQNSIVGQ